MSSKNPVQNFYDTFAEREWTRLDRANDGAIERELHARAFEEFLPPTPCRVLDIGGGPGRWAFWLAERGYQVTLADLSPRLIEIARERIAQAPDSIRANIEDVLVADARDLSAFASESFDAVLSLGPFYHLTDASDRNQAAREAARVLRPGGRLFAAAMPRLFFLLAVAFERERAGPFASVAETLLNDGVYHDPRPGRFTSAYLFRPEEIAPFFAGFGFRMTRLMASEGILAMVQTEVAALAENDPAAYAQLLDMAYQNAADPSILGLAAHLLYIAEKRGSGG
ncbi:MAG: methyltransferase domain-containing protein [Akkermansiaceae bacterium]|nr:methyltransferase domain-containing protein [Armatimonadota bacterium]